MNVPTLQSVSLRSVFALGSRVVSSSTITARYMDKTRPWKAYNVESSVLRLDQSGAPLRAIFAPPCLLAGPSPAQRVSGANKGGKVAYLSLPPFPHFTLCYDKGARERERQRMTTTFLLLLLLLESDLNLECKDRECVCVCVSHTPPCCRRCRRSTLACSLSLFSSWGAMPPRRFFFEPHQLLAASSRER